MVLDGTHHGITICVRSVVLSKGRVLVQKPTDDPGACYAFIGGHLEVGDTLIGRLGQEFGEETNAQMVDCRYLFLVERRLSVNGKLMQSLDHFFAVTLDREDIESREAHLSQHWLPVSSLKRFDLCPWMVRDVIAEGRVQSVRHLVELSEDG